MPGGIDVARPSRNDPGIRDGRAAACAGAAGIPDSRSAESRPASAGTPGTDREADPARGAAPAGRAIEPRFERFPGCRAIPLARRHGVDSSPAGRCSRIPCAASRHGTPAPSLRWRRCRSQPGAASESRLAGRPPRYRQTAVRARWRRRHARRRGRARARQTSPGNRRAARSRHLEGGSRRLPKPICGHGAAGDSDARRLRHESIRVPVVSASHAGFHSMAMVSPPLSHGRVFRKAMKARKAAVWWRRLGK